MTLLILFYGLVSAAAEPARACLSQAPTLKSVVELQIEVKRASVDYYRNLCSELQKESAPLATEDISKLASFDKFEVLLTAMPKEWRATFQARVDNIKTIESLPEKLAAAYELSALTYGQLGLSAHERLWKTAHLELQAQQRSVVLGLVLSKVKKQPNEFGLQIVTFRPFKNPRTVVRIKLMSRSGLTFDLDPAASGRSFEALPVLHEARVSADECVALFECEVNRAAP